MSMSGDSSSDPSSGVENSATVAGDCSRGGRGHGRGRASGGGRGCRDKGPNYYIHCGRINHTSNKC